MTVIVALTDGQTCWVGGDSAGVNGGLHMRVRADPKVFTLTGTDRRKYAIGFTDSWRMGQLLRYGFIPPGRTSGYGLHEYMCTTFMDAVRDRFKTAGWARKDEERELGGNFIVGTGGRLFEIFSDYQVGETRLPYMATGCGEYYALGSLHATSSSVAGLWNKGEGVPPVNRLQLAMQAAAQFSAGVREPFTIVSAEMPAG